MRTCKQKQESMIELENLEKETIKWCRRILRNSRTAIQVLKAAINAVDDEHAGLQDAKPVSKPVAVEKRVRKIALILTMKMMIEALKKRRNLWLLRKRLVNRLNFIF